MPHVERLWPYPVESLAEEALQSAALTTPGLHTRAATTAGPHEPHLF